MLHSIRARSAQYVNCNKFYISGYTVLHDSEYASLRFTRRWYGRIEIFLSNFQNHYLRF